MIPVLRDFSYDHRMTTVVGVMGPGDAATTVDCRNAFELGQLAAREGWITLSGGRRAGVMNAALEGAKHEGGLTVGILPHDSFAGDISPYVDIPILTGLGEARNVLNIMSSRVVFVCGMSSGTASEIALALKVGRHIILVAPDELSASFWRSVCSETLHIVDTPSDGVLRAKQLISDAEQHGPRSA
jgi:uncharacterized protein (TIGR00725 family)